MTIRNGFIGNVSGVSVAEDRRYADRRANDRRISDRLGDQLGALRLRNTMLQMDIEDLRIEVARWRSRCLTMGWPEEREAAPSINDNAP